MRGARGAEGAGNPLLRRPRALVMGLLLTFCLFLSMMHFSHKADDDAVWIWMGMRSDGRCGRDFGTEHIAETKCGKGAPCCSAHGWCGASEEYCSPTLGCQSGCWGADHPRESELSRSPAPAAHDAAHDDEWDEAHNDSAWDMDDMDEYGEGHGYHGRYGGDRYHGYDDDWSDDHIEPDGYDHYVEGSAYDDDPGIYHADEAEELDPDGDTQSDDHDRHAWSADELLFNDNGEDELTDITD